MNNVCFQLEQGDASSSFPLPLAAGNASAGCCRQSPPLLLLLLFLLAPPLLQIVRIVKHAIHVDRASFTCPTDDRKEEFFPSRLRTHFERYYLSKL